MNDPGAGGPPRHLANPGRRHEHPLLHNLHLHPPEAPRQGGTGLLKTSAPIRAWNVTYLTIQVWLLFFSIQH